MAAKTTHTKRIKAELIKAGVTAYGLLKMESRYLPKIIHENETIEAVAYGRFREGSAMLIATSLRIIFLDRKPFFTTMDELTYEMVAGVAVNNQALFSSVTLHTRVKDFTLNFVNPKVANKFSNFIEKRRVDSDEQVDTAKLIPAKPTKHLASSKKIDETSQQFLQSHRTATLSSIDKGGFVKGAVVYYVLVTDSDSIYILSKSETDKVKNILSNPQVALTIFDEPELQTLQITGTASVETDEAIKADVFSQIIQPHWYKNERRLPPVAELPEGAFVVLRIAIKDAKYSDFQKLHRN